MKEVTELLKVLGDANRLRIMKMLERRKMCVCEISHILQISQPSVSRHLKLLVKNNLIGFEQDGLWTNYFLNITNRYAKVLFSNIEMWVDNNTIIQSDKHKSENLDRKKICNHTKEVSHG